MLNSTQILSTIPVDPLTGAIAVPIYQTSTYVQEAPGVNKGFDYTRTNNPTRKILESIIAQLEGGAVGLAFASGLAAIDCVAKLLQTGDEIVAVDDIYGGAYRLFVHVYQKFGIKITFVDTCNPENVKKAITDKTKLVWLESPTNPTLKISDIREISNIAKTVGALVCVDNTFATPVLQNPLELGADIVIHSATKYLGGHSDVLAGLLAIKDPEIGEKLKFIQNATGGVLAPMDSWLVIRGIETLELRVLKHCEIAENIAEYLSTNDKVDKLYYPGLSNHRNHDVAKRDLKAFGGMISFSLKNDSEESAIRFLGATQLFKTAESLGGVKSLICHPASMTHKSVPPENRLNAGIQDSLIRLSVGLENPEDLINDLHNAFEKI